MENAILLCLLLFGATLTNGKENCGRPAIEPVLESGDRIFGGQAAVPNSWPWTADLYDSAGGDFCGGVLISHQHVLTAAHCICPTRGTKFTVHLGSHKRTTRDQTELVRKVKKVCVHSQYPCHLSIKEGSWPRLNDIAIITLQDRVNFSSAISPVCLPSHHEALPIGSAYYVTGWGSTTSTAEQIDSAELKQALVQEMPCTNYPLLAEGLICLRGVTGFHRRGDSGGPMVYHKNGTWTLYGLVHTCRNIFDNIDESSGTATRVSYFTNNFIQPYLATGSSWLNPWSPRRFTCFE
ncbi:chymotrypsinogen B-like [Haemaphysalis longicornis]